MKDTLRLRLRHLLTGVLLLPAALGSQERPSALPFEVGERLGYTVSVARFGQVGKGTMWVDGVASVRGQEAMVLRFDLEAGKGPVRGSDRTTSWFDARRMASLRYEKREKHPLSRHEEAFDLFPADRRWVDGKGAAGAMGTDSPLDELSFIYFLRTVSLTEEGVRHFERHFLPERNPTCLRIVARRTLATPAGEFRTVQLEMTVRDPRRYKGEGVIRIDVSDDERRLPVRIESTMPVFGRTVLTLESAVEGTRSYAGASGKP
jgi:hypothetical protein